MIRTYAPRLFLLALALFWLSLLLTLDIEEPRYSGSTDTPLPYTYTHLEGIEELEFDRELKNSPHYSSSFYIKYANQPYITLLAIHIDNPHRVIKDPFIRQGKRLIFRPTDHLTENKDQDAKKANPKNPKWFVAEIILPLHIKHLHTREINLDISSEQNTIVPSLSIDAKNVTVGLRNLNAFTVHIRNSYTAESCNNIKRTHYDNEGVTKIHNSVHVKNLSLESIYGHIELENPHTIGTLNLQTTPQTSMELEGIGIYARMKWQALPTPARPECEAPSRAAGAASGASATASAP